MKTLPIALATSTVAVLAAFGALAQTPPADARPTAKVVVDDRGRLVVGGAPVFVNGWYSDGTIPRLRRLAEGGFNAVLDYGLTARPIEATKEYLAEAERLGVMVIACFNDVYPSATYRTELGPWKGNAAILDGVLDVVKRSPAVVAYYNNDELPDDKKDEIEGYFRRIRALDPTRPQLMVHEHAASFATFRNAADVFGFDHYPIPQHGPKAFADRFLEARANLGADAPLWAVLQNFAWYQHRPVEAPLAKGDLETERARLPQPSEWLKSGPPTREETRAMLYAGLVSGAQGVLWWCLYNLDYLPDRVERWNDAVVLGRETRALAPFLLADESRAVAWSDAKITSLEKTTPDGRRVLMAVNLSSTPVRAEATWPPPPPKSAESSGAASRPASFDVEVMFERRRARVEEGVLVDFFAPYARHVYAVDP